MGEKKDNALFAVLTRLEDDLLKVERSRDLTMIYIDNLEDELGGISNVSGEWCLEHLLHRLKLLQSVVEAVHSSLDAAACSMAADIKSAYEIYRKEEVK